MGDFEARHIPLRTTNIIERFIRCQIKVMKIVAGKFARYRILVLNILHKRLDSAGIF
jgi:hypothetical protein